MKHAAVSAPARAAAVVLFVLLLLGAAVCGVGTVYLSSEGAYDRAPAFADSEICEHLTRFYVQDALNYFTHGYSEAVPAGELEEWARAGLEALLDPASTNFRLRILDASGALLYGEADVSGLTPLDVREVAYKAPNAIYRAAPTPPPVATSTPNGGEITPPPAATTPPQNMTAAPSPSPADSDAGAALSGDAADGLVTISLTVESYLDPALTAPDAFAFFQPLYTRLVAWRYSLPVLCLVLMALSALLYVFLLCAAGRRPGAAEAYRGWIDRIPTDVFYVLAALLGLFLVWLLSVGYPGVVNGRIISALVPLLLLSACCGILLLLLFVLVSMSTAVRVKTHTWLSSMLVWRFVRWIWRGVCAVCRAIRDVFQNLPSLWKLLLIACAYALLTIVMVAARGETTVFFWLLASAALVLLLCRAALGFARLRKGAHALAEGDLAHQIPLARLPHDERAMAEDLNHIGDGLSRAVEARMKSERMKTDLITNVSHDLKTPLTSIVNYVDLLKKEALHNETADGYVAVLGRQAQKLKKLTEDIVEASKASSGVLNVQLADVDVSELLRQCAAEYGERFAAAQLTPILHVPDVPLVVQADGRLLWRVFDNLLGNVVKYAMPGTRVYLDAAAGVQSATLTIRNISREPLEKSGEELMERFVRGDASRHAEGSGLGLAIAGSLVTLQHGTLSILPDGDLFRAEIRLPLGGSGQPSSTTSPGEPPSAGAAGSAPAGSPETGAGAPGSSGPGGRIQKRGKHAAGERVGRIIHALSGEPKE